MADDKSQLAGIDRRRLLQGLGGASALALAGCTGGGDGGDGGDGGGDGGGGDGSGGDGGDGGMGGGKLTLAQVKSPIEFDPVVLNDVPSGEVSGNIFEGLYDYDAGTKVVPQIATGQPEVSNGGTTWVVEMTTDATFQNGDPVTPEDVKYSFEAPVDEETENASEVNMIDTVSVVDDSTVQFDLKYPYGAFIHTLTWSIVPMSVRESDKEAFNTQSPVGSGAFKFVDWQEGDYVRLERWDDYWGDELPNLAEVEFTPIEEGTTRVTTLRNGENDVIKEIPPKQWSTVQSISDASIDAVPGIGYFYLAFNCNEGPTTDPTVREAIDYVFDMDQAVSNFVEPTGVRQYSPLPLAVAEDWEMPLDEWKGIPHGKDIDQAQSLFDEAGVASDYSWRIIVPPDDKREQIGITVSNGLQEAGFSDVTVQRLDWGAFLDQYISGSADDYNMYTLGWAGTPDPDAFTYYLFGRTEDTLGVTNGSFYGNNSDRGKEVGDMIVQARESADRAERKQLYEDAITMILEDRAHLPAYNLKNSFGVKDYVQDFSAIPTTESFHIFSNHNNVSMNQ